MIALVPLIVMMWQTPTAYALTGARIVTGAGPVIERGTVVLRDGKIEAAGTDIAAPPDAWAIDCRGLTVFPGMIDPIGPAVPEKGITTGFTFPGNGIFSDSTPVGKMITVRLNSQRIYPSSLMGVIAYIRQTVLNTPQPRLLLPANRWVEIERMTGLARELQVDAVLYGGREAGREAEFLKASGMPLLLSMRYADQAGALSKAGVQFAFYSDGLQLHPGERTLEAAQIYHVDDRLGSLETGKVANVLVTDGNTIRYIFVAGVKQ